MWLRRPSSLPNAKDAGVVPATPAPVFGGDGSLPANGPSPFRVSDSDERHDVCKRYSMPQCSIIKERRLVRIEQACLGHPQQPTPTCRPLIIVPRFDTLRRGIPLATLARPKAGRASGRPNPGPWTPC